jgi:hypothetical protein
MPRHRAQIEFDVPSGQTLRDSVEWVSKWFSYYHPRMNAKCTLVEDIPNPVMHGGKLDEHKVQATASDIAREQAASNPDDLL